MEKRPHRLTSGECCSVNILPLSPIEPPRMNRFRSWLAAAPAFADALPAFGLRSPRELFGVEGDPSGRLSSGETVAAWRLEPAGGGEAVVYKRYFYSGLRYAFRPSRAAVECANYLAWHRLGIPGPEPLAAGELRTAGLLRAAVVVTRFIPGCSTLAGCAQSPEFRAAARRGDILRQAAAIAGRAHAAGFFHRDLKLRNILVQNPSGATEPRVFWIDCPRGGFHRLDRGRLAVADLAGMAKLLFPAVTPDEWRRFLADYAAAAGAGNPAHLEAAVATRLDGRRPELA